MHPWLSHKLNLVSSLWYNGDAYDHAQYHAASLWCGNHHIGQYQGCHLSPLKLRYMQLYYCYITTGSDSLFDFTVSKYWHWHYCILYASMNRFIKSLMSAVIRLSTTYFILISSKCAIFPSPSKPPWFNYSAWILFCILLWENILLRMKPFDQWHCLMARMVQQ